MGYYPEGTLRISTGFTPLAEVMSRCAQVLTFKTEEYAVRKFWFEKIVAWSNLEPTVDAFASAKQHLLPRYWDPVINAFAQDWSRETLWMNPPFSMLQDVVDKIVRDRAFGILIIPVWTDFTWFQLLGRIAVDWIDIPHNALLYSTTGGVALRQADRRTRAVLFNAFQFMESFYRELTWFKGLDTMDCTPPILFT